MGTSDAAGPVLDGVWWLMAPWCAAGAEPTSHAPQESGRVGDSERLHSGSNPGAVLVSTTFWPAWTAGLDSDVGFTERV